MKKILTLVAIACATLFSARADLIYTTFDIPAGSSNVGTFGLATNGLYDVGQLSSPGPYPRSYAYRFFTPSVTGVYTLGMTDAAYDPVMILYSGQSSFPANPASGAFALNDDGAWDIGPGGEKFFGTQYVSPTAGGVNGLPGYMPLLRDQSLDAGINYLVAITTYGWDFNPVPLPASFFVAGPAEVTLGSASAGAAVPEPGTWAAAALLVGGAGFMRWRKRAKVS